MRGVVTWATSLTVAIGAAVTSILVAGVTTVLTHLAHPNAPPPPNGASTSQPASPSHGG